MGEQSGTGSFFSGLLQGVGDGLINHEQQEYTKKLKDTEARRGAIAALIQSESLTPDQQALGIKALLAPTLQSPSLMERFAGGAKRAVTGKKAAPQEPNPMDQFFDSFGSLGQPSVPHGPANAPPNTGPLPQPRGTMRDIRLQQESQAQRSAFQGQTDITTRAEAERNRQAFAAKKEELLSIPGMTEGSPAYLNALYGVKIQTDRPENMGTVAAELFEKHRTGKITDAQFDEGIKDLQRINSAAKEKPDVPGVDVPFSPEVATQKADIAKAGRSVSSNSLTNNDIKDIADAIEKGDQPPTTQGLYRNAAPVRAELARRGVPIARMEIDWKATQRFLSTLNGPQQVRIQQAIATASDTLDKLDGLYDEWRTLAPTSGFKVLNRAALATMRNLPGRPGAVAQAMEAQIADLTSELAVVYMGGNTPTDHGLKLAHQNLSTDWNEETFKEGVKQARLNLAIRRNSIIHSVPSGISGQYFQQGQGGTGNIPNISSPPPTGGDFFSGFGGVKKQ